MLSLQEELETIREANLYRSLRRVDSDQGAVITVEGHRVVNFSSNNYLGLANDPRLKQAAIHAIQEFGTGSGASRLVTGSMVLHHELEARFARFKGVEAALVFNSGYHANLGILTALLGEGDVVYSDEWNHASIVDGCRLSKATTQVYRHNDVGHLEEMLRDETVVGAGLKPARTARRLIVTDSIFSMDGDAASLKDLAALAERYDAWLMVDEAHATGVMGPTGKGLVEAVWPQGISPFLRERLIQMGTFGKALGSFGAYVAGSRELIEFLMNKARSFIYTTALPPSVIASSLAALEIVEKEPERRERLWENVRHLCRGVRHDLLADAPTIPNLPQSPIIPLILGDSQKTLHLSQKLFDAGFWVTAIRYPTVAKGTERLRITLMATHTKVQVEGLVKGINQFYRKL